MSGKKHTVLADWYRDQVRPRLEGVIDVEAFEARHHLSPTGQVHYRIGVLGVSGVGKTTLLNALAYPGTATLPVGGIGPRTSTAAEIEFSDRTGFRIDFIQRSGIGALRDRLHDDAAARRAANLLVPLESERDRSTAELSDILAYAAGLTSAAPTSCGAEAHTIERLRTALAKCSVTVSTPETWLFREQIADYVAGPVAFAVRRMQLTSDASWAPEGLTLVDLPGLGVVDDPRASATRDVVPTLDALLILTDRSGLAEVTARLLDELRPSERIVPLLPVVTRIDEIAREEHAAAKSDGRRTQFEEVFAQLSAQAIQMINGQLASIDTSGFHRLRPVAVSAIEHHRLCAADPEDPARLRHESHTGIPELRDALVEMFRAQENRLSHRLVSILRAKGAFTTIPGTKRNMA